MKKLHFHCAVFRQIECTVEIGAVKRKRLAVHIVALSVQIRRTDNIRVWENRRIIFFAQYFISAVIAPHRICAAPLCKKAQVAVVAADAYRVSAFSCIGYKCGFPYLALLNPLAVVAVFFVEGKACQKFAGKFRTFAAEPPVFADCALCYRADSTVFLIERNAFCFNARSAAVGLF